MPSLTCGRRCRLISCPSPRRTLHILPPALHKWDAAERSNRHIYTNSSQQMSAVWHEGGGCPPRWTGGDKGWLTAMTAKEIKKTKTGGGGNEKRLKKEIKVRKRAWEGVREWRRSHDSRLNRPRKWQMMTRSEGDTGRRMQGIRRREDGSRWVTRLTSDDN